VCVGAAAARAVAAVASGNTMSVCREKKKGDVRSNSQTRERIKEKKKKVVTIDRGHCVD
jgi:hypothetical protein